MATKKPANLTTTSDMFSAPAEEVVEETVDVAEPVVDAPGAASTKKARVHGSWRMYWGTTAFDFEDGKTYVLPMDLYEYLKSTGNIYDTL